MGFDVDDNDVTDVANVASVTNGDITTVNKTNEEDEEEKPRIKNGGTSLNHRLLSLCIFDLSVELF